MRRLTLASTLLAAVAGAGALSVRAGVPDPRIEAAFQRFWNAPTPQAAAGAADELVAIGVTFEEAMTRLQTGRAYSKDVPTGVVHASRQADGQTFFYTLDVPVTYDPARRYQVRVHLHGGVTAREDNRPRGAGGRGALAGAEQIYITPDSWVDAPWWSEAQVINLRAILDAVKRTYNVDENRVVLSGVSDGGTGAFYVAMRDTTPYASLLPLNGFLMALATRVLGVRDELFLNNLLNKPFFVVNGGHDPLYPTSIVDPVIRYLQNGGVSVEYRPQPTAGHNTAWWPDVQASFEQFVRTHPRNPLPATLTWQRGEADPFDRAHWLIINRLGELDDDPMQPDVNVIPTPPTLQFGVLTAGTRITRLLPGSTAATLGVRVGDVVVKINEATVTQGLDFEQALGRCCEVGTPIRVLVSRDDTTTELTGTYEPQTTFGPTVPLFARRHPNGRVDLVRAGNTVRARTRGVAEYTLLLSPDAYDFSQPVTVITNGEVSFEGRVEKRVSTLLKWAAVDNDRTVLFGAELHVKVE